MTEHTLTDNAYFVTFAEAPQPIFTSARGGWVDFGTDNQYPTYLLDLFNKSPKHGAIITGKTGYICGNGWKVEGDNPDAIAESFINKVNPTESLAQVTRKCVLDYELYNGYYLQINWGSLGGKIASIYHVDYCKLRTNKDNTQFFYKEDWSVSREQAKVYAAFDIKNPKGTQILYIRNYRPNTNAYSLPEYIAALNYIDSDIAVSKHVLGNAKTGFSSSKQVTFVNGEPPTEDGKKTISRKFKEKFTGTEGNKVVVEFVKNKDQATIINDLGQSDLTKEDFTAVNNLIQQEIFAGHRITSPILFGIKTEGQLGGRSEMQDAYEIFKNTYANEKQMQIEEVFNSLAQINGATEKISIVPVAPLGIDYLNAQILPLLPKAFLYEKLGIDATKYPIPADTNNPTPTNLANDNIKNLTGRQHQNIDRIVRKVSQGKMTLESAKMLLKSGYGLSEEEANTLLTVQSNFSEDDVISIFSEFGENASDYHIIKGKGMFADDVEEELERIEFAEEYTKTQKDILGLYSKNPTATNEDVAKLLKLDQNEADDIIASLIDDGVIIRETNASGIATTTLAQPLSETIDTKPKTTSFRVMYGYDWRSEIPASERNTTAHPSREFCVKMMSMDKLFSRTDIESISARLGYSVFDRQGGFWNNDGEIEYHCRHTWGSRLVIKKPSKNGK